ncbi:MAG: hypothetical protein AAGF92_04130 [Myxococcota bacterium]
MRGCFTSVFVTALFTHALIACSGDGSGTGGSGGSGGAGGGSLACRFNATVDGEFSESFDGAAEWQLSDDFNLQLTLRSRAFINDGTDPFVIDVETESVENLVPGTYTIVAGEISGSDDWTAQYIRGVEGFDCPNCGGTVEITTVDDDSIAGGFALEAPVMIEDEDSGEVAIASSFTALQGSDSDPDSPYAECEATYEP